MNKKKIVIGVVVAIPALLLIIQAVPYGRDHDNPPVLKEPAWTSAERRAIAQRACFDCHSNETVWPWYASVAPVSWLVQHDVEEGRSKLNFSDWARKKQEVHEAAELIEEGEMPLPIYLPLHSEAALTEAETRELIEEMHALSRVRYGKNYKPGEH